jgi:anti-sigma regulatory factor (Ser/Thr protein kinase)
MVDSATCLAGFRPCQSGHLTSAVRKASRAKPGLVAREVRTSSVVHLPCSPASVALARRALSDELSAAGVFDSAVKDAVLVISELLSNAILHAYPLPGEQLQVAWAVDGAEVEVAVSDGGSATIPHAGHPAPSAVSGRGLSIVEHLALTWGVRTDEVGLTVWAVLAAPRHNGSAARDLAAGSFAQASNGDSGSWRRADIIAGLPKPAAP